jgi:hypothetical protein
MSCTSIK